MSGFPPLFLLNNRSMMGFGTRELTVFQIAKELVDNSVDSIRQLGAEDKNVNLVLTVQGGIASDNNLLRIECSDSGAGINFPLNDAMKAFGTSKINTRRDLCGTLDEEEAKEGEGEEEYSGMEEMSDKESSGVPTCGKFGVGLSACLLFSSVDNNSSFPLTVFTKPVQSDKMKMAKFDISRNKTPVLVEYREEYVNGNEARNHWTRIALFARMPTCSAGTKGSTEGEEGEGSSQFDGLDSVTNKIERYVSRLKMLSGDLRITLKVTDPVRGTRVLVGGEPSTPGLAGRVAQWSRSKSGGLHSSAASTAVVGESHSVQVSSDLTFTCTASLLCEVILSGTTASSSSSNTPQTKCVPIQLLRYFNSSPVVDDGESSSSQGREALGTVAAAARGGHCDVKEAVLGGVKWTTFGCRLDSSTQPPRLSQTADRSLEQDLLRMNIRGDTALQSATGVPNAGTHVVIKGVLLILDSQGDLPYADMQKHALTFAGFPTARNACIKAVMSSIQKLRREIIRRTTSDVPSPFLASKKEYHDYILHCQAVPSIAGSLSRMLHSGSVSEDKLARVLALLGLGQTSTSSTSHTSPLEAEPPLSTIEPTRGRLEALLHQFLQGAKGNDEPSTDTAIGVAAADLDDPHHDQHLDDDSADEWI